MAPTYSRGGWVGCTMLAVFFTLSIMATAQNTRSTTSSPSPSPAAARVSPSPSPAAARASPSPSPAAVRASPIPSSASPRASPSPNPAAPQVVSSPSAAPVDGTVAPVPSPSPAAAASTLLVETQEATIIAAPTIAVEPPPGWIPGPCGSSPTKWGYQCSVTTPHGISLYWSNGVQVPQNPCTGKATVPAADVGKFIHFMAEGWLPSGRMEVAFPDEDGVLYPALTVSGRVGIATKPQDVNHGEVTTYLKKNVRDDLLGFDTATLNSFAVRQRSPTVGIGSEVWDKTMLLCFSRLRVDPLLPTGRDLTKQAKISWAVYNRSEIDLGTNIERPSRTGSATLDLQTGGIRYSMSPRPAIVMAHGALMIAAFGALVPLAAMLNRHEWIFGKGQGTSRSWAWYSVRIITQVVALGTALAGVVMVLVVFGNSNPGSRYWPAHQAIGLIALSMAILQLPLWLTTRRASTPIRRMSNTMNSVGAALGIANMFIGVMLVHDIQFIPVDVWVVPAAVVGGSSVVLAVILEVFKYMRGQDPDTDFVAKDHNDEEGGRLSKAMAPGQLAPIKTRAIEDLKAKDMSSVVQSPYGTPGSRGSTHRKSTAGSGSSTPVVAAIV